MLHFLPFAFLSALLHFTPPAAPAARPAYVEPCKIFGAIYIEKNRSFADYTVFVEESDAFADVVVFKEDNKLFADQPGLWYIVDDPAFANFRVALSANSGTADFKIFYTPSRAFAGCRR